MYVCTVHVCIHRYVLSRRNRWKRGEEKMKDESRTGGEAGRRGVKENTRKEK